MSTGGGRMRPPGRRPRSSTESQAKGRRPVEVDPWVAREVLRQSRSPSDDAGGQVKEAFAPEKHRRGLIGVDAAAMQVAVSVGDTPANIARAIMRGPPKKEWDYMKGEKV